MLLKQKKFTYFGEKRMKFLILFLITSLSIHPFIYSRPKEINWRTMNAGAFKQIRDAEIEQSWMPECLANCCGIFGLGVIEVCEENVQIMLDYLNNKDYRSLHEMLYDFSQNTKKGYPGLFNLLSLIVQSPKANSLLEFMMHKGYLEDYYLCSIKLAIEANNAGAVRLIGDHCPIQDDDKLLLETLFAGKSWHDTIMRSNVYRLLKDPNRKITNTDRNGQFDSTLLHLEATFGCFELVKYFIEEKNANVDIRDGREYTPSERARLNGFPDLSGYIERKSASYYPYPAVRNKVRRRRL